MSIICKLFGHSYEHFDMLPAKMSGVTATTTLIMKCTRCKTVHMRGHLLDVSETLAELGNTKLQLSQANMLINSAYGVALRAGRTTDWQALENDCVDMLLDNQRILKSNVDNVLQVSGKDYLKAAKRSKAQ